MLKPLSDIVTRFRDAEALSIDLFAGDAPLKLEDSGVALMPGAKVENWDAAHRLYAIAYEQSGLIEENWDEWRRSGLQSKGKVKPWQEKFQELQRDVDSALADWQALRP